MLFQEGPAEPTVSNLQPSHVLLQTFPLEGTGPDAEGHGRPLHCTARQSLPQRYQPSTNAKKAIMST